MKSIIDNFSSEANEYARFRPLYPETLYEFIFSHTKSMGNAWDAGTGSGQVAVRLSSSFTSVSATDISVSQLQEATKKTNIAYTNTRVEKTNFPPNSFNLISVAQAIHWFDIPAFYAEVNRVSKPGGVLAVWGYNLINISTAIDLLIRNFYTNMVGPFWDAERTLIESSYQTIPFPFDEIKSPGFEINVKWTFEQLMGYLKSWSSVKKYTLKKGANPVDLMEHEFKKAWGEEETKDVVFPLFTRIGIVKGR